MKRAIVTIFTAYVLLCFISVPLGSWFLFTTDAPWNYVSFFLGHTSLVVMTCCLLERTVRRSYRHKLGENFRD